MSSDERLEAVERAIKHHPKPVLSAPEVAEAVSERSDVYDDVGDARREAHSDLSLLERVGTVESNQVGANARAWWHTDRVVPAPPESAEDHPDQADLESATVDRRELVDGVDDQERDAGAGARDQDDRVDGLEDVSIDDALVGWSPGNSLEEEEERLEAARAVLEWLRDRDLPGDGWVMRRHVIAETYPDLAPDDQNEDTFWDKTAREAFQRAEDVGLVESTHSKYRWIGD